MKITNQDLQNDILDIVAKGATYTNTKTGVTVTGVFLNDIHEALRGLKAIGRHKAYASALPSGRIWSNVSQIDNCDLRDIGFKIVRGENSLNSSDIKGGGDWTTEHNRTLAKSQTLIAL